MGMELQLCANSEITFLLNFSLDSDRFLSCSPTSEQFAIFKRQDSADPGASIILLVAPHCNPVGC